MHKNIISNIISLILQRKVFKLFYLKCLYYGIYMIWIRINGIKWSYINKFKGEDESWEYGQKVFTKWALFVKWKTKISNNPVKIRHI